jgi:hypothetical protein
VLAALPSGARPALRLCCRAGRGAVDGHTRRLRVGRKQTPLSFAAVARMPLLQEAELSAEDDAETLALAAALPALARLRRATVSAEASGCALGVLVSALASLRALTGLALWVHMKDTQWAAPPLVLPWAHIEVGAARCSLRGGLPAGTGYEGHLTRLEV